MGNTAKLFLLPVDIGNKDLSFSIPELNKAIISKIELFVCENVKTARRFLINSELQSPIPEEIQFISLSNDDNIFLIKEIITQIKNGKNCAYLSEAGNPCIADPGEKLVLKAHEENIEVKPLIGPSSILLALISSGCNAEKFTFSGYLNRKTDLREHEIKKLISDVNIGITQIFMETPYRNNGLLKDLLHLCPDHFLLTIASELTTESEYIKTKSIQNWKAQIPDLHKKPVIFVLGIDY